MVRPLIFNLIVLAAVLLARSAGAAERHVVVGSKAFNENYILAEMMALVLEDNGYRVTRKLGLEGTMVCFEALRIGEIDVYPEYSGTVGQVILKLGGYPSFEELGKEIARRHPLELLKPFGFDNSYGIGVRRDFAQKHGLKTIGDLTRLSSLRINFSHEFIQRKDGWPGLSRAYGLEFQPGGIEHGLAYTALAAAKIDVTDVYLTDGDIKKFDLFILRDDRDFFPDYLAAPLVRAGLDEEVKEILGKLSGALSGEAMIELNARSMLGGETFRSVAGEYVYRRGLVRSAPDVEDHRWARLLGQTVRHLELTIIALLAAMVTAIPLGIAIYSFPRYRRPVMYIAGILQTVPSLALLALMVPLLGVGATTAVTALFLYSLLPILRNTTTALYSVDPVLRKVSMGMGLTAWQRLRYVEIPLAVPTILAGIKTAAVVNIGTATLAALIGAGGLGEPILQGLTNQNKTLILEGAIPAALLAILTEFAFEGVERFVIPRHLRETNSAVHGGRT